MKESIRNIIFRNVPEAKPQNCLGIYLSKDTATVVCLGSQNRGCDVLSCFSVSSREHEEQNPEVLAGLISQGCAERGLEFSEVAVALDCAMFMQHNVHSGFSDPKQIAATIRFDTEEALARDVSDVAIAFDIISSDQSGSHLSVFTAQKKVLSDILLALQSNNIDPIAIEPDVSCLSKFVCRNVSSPETQQGGTLYGILSHQSGYLVVPPSSTAAGTQKTPVVQTFLIGPTQGRNGLLSREVLMTIASSQTEEPINCLRIFDLAGSVDCQQLENKLGIEVRDLDLVASAAVDPQSLADCNSPVDFAIAFGVALAHEEKTRTINFRNDFMPYQGKKLRLQKALKVASYSVTILMLAVGLYFQANLWKVNRDRSAARKIFAKDYAAVMLGQGLPQKMNPLTKLKNTITRIKRVNSGQLGLEGEKSISAKLILVLQAFNSCAKRTNLNTGSITITERNISIVGDTSSRGNTLRLFEAIKKAGLDIQQQRLYTKERRDHFTITIVAKN